MNNVEWARRQASKYENECIRMGCLWEDEAAWQRAKAQPGYLPIQYSVWRLWQAYLKVVNEFEAKHKEG